MSKEWFKEIDDELKAIFNISKCYQCGKEITKPIISLLEHGFKHIHHFCCFQCLGKWGASYKKLIKDA